MAGTAQLAELWKFSAEGEIISLTTSATQEVVVVDDRRLFYLLGPEGKVHWKKTLKTKPLALAMADDGSAIGLLCQGGRLENYGLGGELIWQVEVPSEAISLDMEPQGRSFVVGTKGGEIIFFNSLGREVGRTKAAHEAYFLRLAPQISTLLSASRFAQVTYFDPGGDFLWEVSLGCNLQDVALSGSGDLILLAALARHIFAYNGEGEALGAYRVGGWASWVETDRAGRFIFAANTQDEIVVLSRAGEVLFHYRLREKITSLAASASGHHLAVGMRSGKCILLQLLETEEGAAGFVEFSEVEAKPRPTGEEIWGCRVFSALSSLRFGELAVSAEGDYVALINSLGVFHLFGGNGIVLVDEVAIEGSFHRLAIVEAAALLLARSDRFLLLLGTKDLSRKFLFFDKVRITHSAISPEGAFFILSDDVGRILFYNRQCQRLWERRLPGGVADLADSASGEVLAAVSEEGRITGLDTKGKEIFSQEFAKEGDFWLLSLPGPPGVALAVGARPEGSLFILITEAGKVFAFDLGSQEVWEKDFKTTLSGAYIVGDFRGAGRPACRQARLVLRTVEQEHFVLDTQGNVLEKRAAKKEKSLLLNNSKGPGLLEVAWWDGILSLYGPDEELLWRQEFKKEEIYEVAASTDGRFLALLVGDYLRYFLTLKSPEDSTGVRFLEFPS